MKDVTKNLPLILSIVTALTFIGITVQKTGIINRLRFELGTAKKDLSQTKSELDAEIRKNEMLELEREVLLDSITKMQFEIATLNDRVESLKNKVGNLNHTIQKQQDRIGQLNKRINALKKSNADNEQEISRLQAELEQELTEMEILDNLRAENKNLQARLESQQRAYEAEIANLKASVNNQSPALGKMEASAGHVATAPALPAETMEVPLPKINEGPSVSPLPSTPGVVGNAGQSAGHQKMLNIVQNTSVTFLNVSLRNKEDGKDLKKIKADKWRYTYIAFELDNQDKEAIMDEMFIVQLYDVDKGQVVPFNEQNNAFPQSGQGSQGFKFQYTGQPVLVRYYNYQEKQGANYDIRLIYASKNMAIPLKNGTMRIVEDGDVKPLF